ncbi:MAG: Ger(x)C family spore germination protein [Ruminiclostridium sp.]|nr:Ger(x)C family spore germination protein [Ruminiclostridium sp.]
MRRVSKICSFMLMSILLIGLLSACYDKREIDDLAYAVAIGFDEGKSNHLRITLQIAKPGAIASSGTSEGGGGGNEKPYMITTVEAPTLYSALNMVNTYVSRQINLSTVVALIFSKSLAEKGIEHLVNAVVRQREFRPNMYIAVSRTTAEEYINGVKPVLEKNPSKYYNLNFTTYRYTSFSANTQFGRFSNYMDSQDHQPVAILCGINKNESSDDITSADSTYGKKGRTYPLEGDFKAGDMPRTGEDKSETIGLAVFDGEKMVGELDGEETAYYLFVTGEYKNAFWTFPDPQVKDRFILLNIRQNRNPRTEMDLIDGKAEIKIKVLLEADILSIQSGINYERGENTKKLEQSVINFLADGTKRLLNKTAKEYHSDIFGFGSAIRSKTLTWKEFEAFKWKSRYKESSFNVEINLKIRRTGLISGSSKAVNSYGEGGIQY